MSPSGWSNPTVHEIERCGGFDVFAGRRGKPCRERVVEPEVVIAANPDIIVASWSGRRVDLGAIRARPGFPGIRAVPASDNHTIQSDLLLQPAPRVLDGGRELRRIFEAWRHACIPAPAPSQ